MVQQAEQPLVWNLAPLSASATPAKAGWRMKAIQIFSSAWSVLHSALDSAGEKTSNSIAMEKSAILPDAGGSNSAASTVQSGGNPMEVRTECPPDSKPK